MAASLLCEEEVGAMVGAMVVAIAAPVQTGELNPALTHIVLGLAEARSPW